MSLVSILFGEAEGKIGEVVCDALLSEEHHLEARASEHPIEDGTSISDHIQIQPTTISLEGIITSTPLNYILFPLPIKSERERVDRAMEQLESIFAARQPITIATTLKSYSNMVLESLSIKRDSRSQKDLRFTCKAKQIKIVGEKRIHISPSQAQYQSKKELGKQSTSKPSAPTEQKTKSMLSMLRGMLDG